MKKINKSAARKLYMQKKSFIIVPCKCAPTSIFALEVKSGWMFRNFDVFYNEFYFYNCNSETGNYPAFYVKED
jgi:hypothetical protein